MKVMPRAICFDFDGTLASFGGEFDLLLDALRNDLGLQACDFRALKERLGTELTAGGPVTLRDASRSVIEGFELRVPADLDEVVAQACAEYAAGVTLRPGALELLQWLDGQRIPMALVSNGPWDMQQAALRRVGIEKHFGTVLFSGDRDVASRKPARRIFDLALTGLRSLPEETLMIGDDVRNDIGGAVALGMPAVLIAQGPTPDLPAGDVEVLPDLPAVHRRLEALAAQQQEHLN